MSVPCRTAAVLVLALSLFRCSSAPASDENDPYEATNRQIFALNQSVDKSIAKPVAVFYTEVVPEGARDGVHNFLLNLGLPVTFANDVLQGEPRRAFDTVGRFVVNSTVGIGGLVDVAQKTGIPEHSSDFGETLAIYGVQEGPYLVLPVLGPSNPRDALGTGVDVVLDPATWITFRSSVFFKLGRGAVGVVDARAQNIEALDQLERSSVDLYASLRSLYRQHRQAEINHGKANIENLPNF